MGFDKSEIYRQQSTDPVILQACKSKTDTADYILRNCINDHQHWHLGNTITFTPFKDIQILKWILELDEQKYIIELIDNIVDARLEKELIAKNDPNLLQFLTANKNQDRTGIYRLCEYLS